VKEREPTLECGGFILRDPLRVSTVLSRRPAQTAKEKGDDVRYKQRRKKVYCFGFEGGAGRRGEGVLKEEAEPDNSWMLEHHGAITARTKERHLYAHGREETEKGSEVLEPGSSEGGVHSWRGWCLSCFT